MKRRKERFRIFVRTWWAKDAFGSLVPNPGPSTTIGYAATERDARQQCAKWNATHKPGELSRKAEYSEDIARSAS